MKEFVDARRRVLTLQNAPQVLFRSDPPLELQGVPGLQKPGEGETSYVTFGERNGPDTLISNLTVCTVLFPRHLTPQRRYENISHIQTFRDYFHYHIKASKVTPPAHASVPDHLLIPSGIHPHEDAQEDGRLPAG